MADILYPDFNKNLIQDLNSELKITTFVAEKLAAEYKIFMERNCFSSKDFNNNMNVIYVNFSGPFRGRMFAVKTDDGIIFVSESKSPSIEKRAIAMMPSSAELNITSPVK
jgi:hypothetical protein